MAPHEGGFDGEICQHVYGPCGAIERVRQRGAPGLDAGAMASGVSTYPIEAITTAVLCTGGFLAFAVAGALLAGCAIMRARVRRPDTHLQQVGKPQADKDSGFVARCLRERRYEVAGGQ